jgi:hypothetical protein
MKKFLVLILLFPLTALAHGGVSKDVGNATVYLNQSPISPFVGEKVVMAFSLKDKNSQPLKNLTVKLTLIDTYLGDQSKDKVILTQNVVTEVNGDFEFDYTFPKENYFDVEMDFADPITHEDLNTGFLVQPRDVSRYKILIAVVGVGCLAIGYWIGSKFASYVKIKS